MVEEPWNLRIIDLRDREACAQQRVPGSECVPADKLGEMGLEYSPGHRDLVIVTPEGGQNVPSAALGYPGHVLHLQGGFAAWEEFALRVPEPPGPAATEADRQAYLFQAALYQALTGAGAAGLSSGGPLRTRSERRS